MRKRKILSYLLSLTLVMTSMPTQLFAAQVDAQSNETYIDLEQQTTTESVIKVGQPHEYSGDGFNVSFEVTDQWAGAFNANMTILNTGKKALENWTLSFDFDHEITNIWGAQIVSHEGNTYVIKNATYNQDIEVGDSVTIGFSALGDEIKAPSNFDMLIQEEQVANKDYTIGFKVISDWGSAFNGEISITNNTEKDIEDWRLEFDFDREITAFWTANIEQHEGNHYLIKNAGYNANIKAGETLTLGFAGTPGNVNDEPQNYILNQIGQEIDHEKDTDEDGIPDYYEKIIGTNPNSMDSDSDGLPDGYEYFYLETDPALKDTDGNGIDDGEEDFDADGLENLQEYKLETNPFNKDTDGDSLSDGDEVNIYDTDPLLYDTDGDSLCDSDEIEIGLDPNNRYTHDNILDSEYKLWQNLNQQQVEDINFDRSAYEVEVNLFASGNIHTGLSVGSSDYDVALKDNRSIVSTPIQMKYQGGNIEKGKLIFTINDELISNQASLYPSLNLGIERYCIFNYDEDINLLYPVLTEYDEANNKLSTDITSDGTFCVIDLESWLYDLGIEIDEEELGQLVASSKSMSMKNYKCVAASNLGESMNQDIDYQDISQEQLDEILNVTTEETNNSISSKKMLKAANKSTVNKQVDLVLIIDSTGSMGSYIAKVKSNLAQLISDLRKQNVSLYVSVVDYKDITCDGNNSTKVNNNLNVDFMNNINDMSKVLGTVSATGGGDGPETALDAVGATLNLKFRTNASKYAFIITDASTKLDNNYGVVSMFDAATKLKNKGIYTSVIAGSYYKSHYVDIYEKSNGIWIDLATNFNNDMYNFILNGSQSATKYSAILSSGLTSVTLDTPLTKDSDTDTDLDGIPDSDEVDWTYITEEVGEDGKPQIKLPTLGTLIEKGVGCSLDGLSKMPLLSLILKLQVLPVESSPISEDGDGDYYLDIQDDNPLQSDPMFIDDEAIIDTYHAEDIEMNFVEGNENNSIRFMSYAKIESTDKISDGKLTYEDPCVPKQPNKGYITFSRKTTLTMNANDCVRFELRPNYNSDYKFYVENVGDSNDIKIKVYKGNSTNNRDLIKANTSYGSSWFYSLEAKQTYTIYVYQKNSSVKPYEFRVEQDNWVYAPNGGKWKRTQSKDGSLLGGTFTDPPTKQIYITQSLLYESACVEKGKYIKNEAAIRDAMENLGYDKKDYVINKTDWTLTILGLAGFVAMVYQFEVGGGFVVMLKEAGNTSGKAAFLVGTASTSAGLYGLLPVIDKKLKELEYNRINDVLLNNNETIVCTHTRNSTANIWDEWKYCGYINKYQQGFGGQVTTQVTVSDVISFCKWNNPQDV